jgi:phenylacetate-CoA ligase
MEEASPHYQLIVNREHNLDTLEIKVELNEKYWSDEIKVLEGIKKLIDHKISNVLGLHAAIKLVEPRSIERSEGKAKRVIDNRKL